MDYPNIPFLLDTTDTRNDPVLMSTARSGMPKTRRLQDRARREFSIVHRGLTDADKATVETFLTTNRMTAFVIYHPCKASGTAYSVIEKTGVVEWSRPDGAWSAKIDVIEA